MTAATQPELDLGAWLLRQADADEARAIHHLARQDPARALAVVRLVREMVALHGPNARWCMSDKYEDPPQYTHDEAGGPCQTLRLLAVTLYGERDGAGRWGPCTR